MNKQMKRGEIYYADLSPAVGSEQGGIRPVLVVQNDVGNKCSPTIICAAMTSKNKTRLPTHVQVHNNRENGLKADSTVMLEQIRVIDKTRVKGKIGYLDEGDLSKVMEAMKVSLAIV